MRALVTGGAGFIGSHLTQHLRSMGAEVAVLDDLSSGYLENLPDDIEFFHGDVADAGIVAQATRDREVVFHLAAHRAVLRSVERPQQTDRANVGGTLTVLTAARDAGVRRVVNSSSSSIYGGAESMPTRESEQPQPRSPYAVSKLAAEHYCRVFWELYGLETVNLRYFNVFGPRQRPDSQYATVIPIFMSALRGGEPVPVHGDGLQSRDFTYVADVVAANLAAATAPKGRCAGGSYNIARGERHSLLDLIEIIGALLDVDATLEFQPSRAGDVRHTHADVTAAVRDLGYLAQIPLPDGLRRTVEWFVDEYAASDLALAGLGSHVGQSVREAKPARSESSIR